MIIKTLNWVRQWYYLEYFSGADGYDDDLNEQRMERPVGEGNLVSSLLEDSELHMPVLDIDFPAQLIPSSTPGHFHLYLDRTIDWDRYVNLLRALADAGIIEYGYAEASIRRGATYVRAPGVSK